MSSEPGAGHYIIKTIEGELGKEGSLKRKVFETIEGDLDKERSNLKGKIINLTSTELAKPKGSAYEDAVEKAIARSRDKEVGALQTGHFVLTPATSTYTFTVYFPEGYKGVLRYRLRDTKDPSSVRITWNNKTQPLDSLQNSFPLEKFFNDKDSNDNQFVSTESQKSMQGLKTIQFSLRPDEEDQQSTRRPGFFQTGVSASGSALPGIRIDYVTFIAPAMRMDK